MTTFKNTRSSNPKKFFSWIQERRFKILLAGTLLMILISSMCTIPGLIDHPQFTTPISGDWVETQLRLNDMLWAYYTFFIIDYFWAFLLLWVIYYFVKEEYKKTLSKWKLIPGNEHATHWVMRIGFVFFIIVICAAYSADCIENYIYLKDFYYPEGLVNLKIALYTAVALLFLILVIRKYFKVYNKTVLSFLKASVYSLFIIVIIGVLLPTATQINSIVVNLYDHPLNLFILLVISAPIYSVMLAHYPSYFNIDEKFRKWYRAFCRLGLASTVFYRRNKDHKGDSDGVIEGDLNFLFRILGILFYVALFYLIAFTSEINFKWGISTSGIAITMLALGIYVLYNLTIRKNTWLYTNIYFLSKRIPFSEGDYNPRITKQSNKPQEEEEENSDEKANEEKITKEEANALKALKRLLENRRKSITAKLPISKGEKENLQKILPSIRAYLWVLTTTIIFHVLLFGYFGYAAFIAECNDCFYSRIPVLLSLLCIFSQMITYIYYRTFRSILKFVFFSKDNDVIINAFYIMRVIEVNPKEEVQLSQYHIDFKKKQLLTFFEQKPFGDFTGILKFYSRWNNGIFNIKFFSFGSLSNDVLFLQFTIVFGLINTFFLIIINSIDWSSFYFNAALIILSSLFLYYGILVVLTKNYIFYKYSKESYAMNNRKKFKFYLVLGFFILFLGNRLGRIFPNDLFTLETVDRVVSAELDLETYVSKLPEKQTRYYIGAYGGGMKSNAWTLSVLNKFYNDDPQFLEKAVVISGASGGTMGLINWSAIVNREQIVEEQQKMITNISTEHVLSLDLTHILGRDTFNHLFIPGINLSGKDRSTRAMQRYASLSGNSQETVNSIPFRVYWKELYESKNSHFPILIANTTNVSGNQGMAVSIQIDENKPEYSLLYQGANNILDLERIEYIDNDTIPTITDVTLSYYNAASTSNRFPLISPAATIKTLGQYNDGGIYDNSGLLSAYKLFRSINRLDSIRDLSHLTQRNVFINIVNDKNLYIKNVVEKSIKDTLRINKINESTEINAILNSIASTEMMPIYIKKELERLDKEGLIDFKTIYLPHTFTMNDVKNIYGEELELGNGQSETYKSLYQSVLDNDSKIKGLLNSVCDFNYGRVIEPPMSRVLANDAYDFMKSMLGKDSEAHKDIQEIISIK
ncbi:hypothetical protein [Dokdonia sp.]|uniref:hypothetical protein n=1 Tax=Dokdonia sp. TaxID=2024995 RepID=UPI003267E7C2